MAENDFVRKIKYECKFCHKLFATTKHDCKWNPEKKNCLTCEHCVGFEKGRGTEYNSTLGFIAYEPSYFVCKEEHECNEVDSIARDRWNGYCDYYEKAECDDYVKRYAKIVSFENDKSLENSYIF